MAPNEATRNFDTLPDAANVPVQTVAQILGISVAGAWRLAKSGKLTPRKIGQRSTRFNCAEVRKLAAGGVQ